MTKLTLSLIALSTLLGAASAGVLDKQKALETQTFWDNRDWEWYNDALPKS
jgi:hypothetical protein